METMSEDHMPYNENLATMLEAVDKRRHAITTDPAASHWLKRVITELWERDAVDALNDLDVLRDLLEAKYHAYVLTLQRMVTNDDGIRH
jgi:hypothetical protein